MNLCTYITVLTVVCTVVLWEDWGVCESGGAQRSSEATMLCV